MLKFEYKIKKERGENMSKEFETLVIKKLDSMDGRLSNIDERLSNVEEKVSDIDEIKEKISGIDEIKEKVSNIDEIKEKVSGIDEMKKKVSKIDIMAETLEVVKNSVLIIEDKVNREIPALFDIYNLNYTLQKEKKIDSLENQSDNLTYRVDSLEDTVKEHSIELKKLIS